MILVVVCRGAMQQSRLHKERVHEVDAMRPNDFAED